MLVDHHPQCRYDRRSAVPKRFRWRLIDDYSDERQECTVFGHREWWFPSSQWQTSLDSSDLVCSRQDAARNDVEDLRRWLSNVLGVVSRTCEQNHRRPPRRTCLGRLRHGWRQYRTLLYRAQSTAYEHVRSRDWCDQSLALSEHQERLSIAFEEIGASCLPPNPILCTLYQYWRCQSDSDRSHSNRMRSTEHRSRNFCSRQRSNGCENDPFLRDAGIFTLLSKHSSRVPLSLVCQTRK